MFLSDIRRHSVITKTSLGKIRHFTKYVHYSTYKFHHSFIHSFCHVFINSTPLVIILYVPATPKLCEPIKLIACNYSKYTVSTCFLESSPHPQVTNIRTVSLTNYVSYPILTSTSNTIRRKQSPAVFPTKNTYVDSAIRFLTTWMKTYIFLRKDFLNHLLSQLWMQSQHSANQEEKVSYQKNLRASKKVKYIYIYISEIIQWIFKEAGYN